MSDWPLAGRTALVTGAGRGLGANAARWLAAAGAQIVICARTSTDIDTLAEELRNSEVDVIAERCDVADAAAVDALVARAVERFGGIDVAVANAAVLGPIGVIEGTDPLEWAEALQINVAGTAAVVRAVLPSMRARGWGRILTMSGAGVGGPNLPERVSAYVASKGATMVLTEALAKELPSGVTINAIAPGAIPTGFMHGVLEAGPEIAGTDLFDAAQASTMPDLEPLREMIMYLTSEDSAWLNGRCLSVRWDPPAKLMSLDRVALGESRLRLRRIDEDLYSAREANP